MCSKNYYLLSSSISNISTIESSLDIVYFILLIFLPILPVFLDYLAIDFAVDKFNPEMAALSINLNAFSLHSISSISNNLSLNYMSLYLCLSYLLKFKI